MGWGNPKKYCRLGKVIETTPAGKEFRVLIVEKLKVSQQRAPSAQTAQMHPGLHKKRTGQQAEGGDFPPLLCPHENPPGVLHSALESLTQGRTYIIITTCVAALQHNCLL